LRIASPAISRVGNGGWPGLSVYTAPNVSSRKRQSIARASFTNAWFMSMIWSSRERNSSCSTRGRIANPPLNQLEREESRLSIRGNPQNRICKEIAFQRPKTGKFDYLGVPNHPAHSVAFEFFTDDYCLWLILKTLPEAPAFGGDMKAATASARVQRVRYSYSPSISLPV
jgi:hypothetical protein